MTEQIVILDFGSQYTQVIARRIRECQVYSQILRFDTSAAKLAALKPRGLILSGGPASVYGKGAPHCDPAIWNLGIPVLGWGTQIGFVYNLGSFVPLSSFAYKGEGWALTRDDHRLIMDDGISIVLVK